LKKEKSAFRCDILVVFYKLNTKITISVLTDSYILYLEKSAFQRNGDVMVQVWKEKTCANDKYDP